MTTSLTIPAPQHATRPRVEQPVLIAAALSFAAGVIHLAVVPEHFEEAWRLGAFFLVVGLLQVGYAATVRLLLAPVLLVGAIVAHVALIALYVLSRTVDLPFIPPHTAHTVKHLPVAGGVGNGTPIYPGSRIEEVGVLDMACLFAELGLIVVLTSLLPARIRGPLSTAMLVLGAAALVARGTGLLA